ncbi:MAG: hypothetical protein AAB480_00980 [Patescibacteria group bacterium]
MLAGRTERIDDVIVGKLAERPAQTAAELFVRVRPHIGDVPTPQGWYKALRRLIAQEVLIKTGKLYSLNTRWLLSIIRLAEQAEQTHLTHPPLPTIRLPRGRERVTYRFKNLLEMDTFWGHLLVYIAARAKKPRVLYAYNPHFWFYLAHEQAEKEYNKGMRDLGVKTIMLIGSKSFLDRWNANFFDNSIRAWLHPVPLFKDSRVAYNLLGEYFMEIKISPESAKSVDTLFAGAKSLNDVSPLALLHMLHSRQSCSITISRGATKSRQLRRLAKRYVATKRIG